jgi:hypothetical protein
MIGRLFCARKEWDKEEKRIGILDTSFRRVRKIDAAGLVAVGAKWWIS